MASTMITLIPPPADTEPAAPDEQNELSAIQKRRLLKAAELIMAGMRWDGTAEGFEFWSAVYERLRNIARGEPLC